MICSVCGQSIAPGNRFCTNCGSPVSDPRGSSVQPESTDPKQKSGGQSTPPIRTSQSTANLYGLPPLATTSFFSSTLNVAGRSQEGPSHSATDPSVTKPESLAERPSQSSLSDADAIFTYLNRPKTSADREAEAEAVSRVPQDTPEIVGSDAANPLWAGAAETPAALGSSEIVSRVPFSEGVPGNSGNRAAMLVVGALLLAAIGVAVWLMQPTSLRPGSDNSGIVVGISPASATVAVGLALDLSATVTAQNPEVIWQVREGDAGGRVISRGAKAVGDKVSLQAVYIAPNTPGTYHVSALSKADPSKFATAAITVTGR